MKKVIIGILCILLVVLTSSYVTTQIVKKHLSEEQESNRIAQSNNVSFLESYLESNDESASENANPDNAEPLQQYQKKEQIDKNSLYFEKRMEDVLFQMDTDDPVVETVLHIAQLQRGDAGSSLRLLYAACDFLALALQEEKSLSAIRSCLEQMDDLQRDFFSFQLHGVFFEALRVIDRGVETQDLWENAANHEKWMDCTSAQAVHFMSLVVRELEAFGVQNEWDKYDLSPILE